MKPLRRLGLGTAEIGRALVEGAAILGVLFAGLAAIRCRYGYFTAELLLTGVTLAALWMALRSRFQETGLWRWEILTSLGVGLLAAVAEAGLVQAVHLNCPARGLAIWTLQWQAGHGVLGGLMYLALRLALSGARQFTGLARRKYVYNLAGIQLLAATVSLAVLILLIQTSETAGEVAALPEVQSGQVPGWLALVLRLPEMVGLQAAVIFGTLCAFSPLLLALSFFVARRLTRRVQHLAEAARQMQGGNLEARVAVEGEDELAQLQETFNQMAADLQRSSQALQDERDKLADLLQGQRELAAGISHELRTPLSVARGHLENGQALLDGWQKGIPDPEAALRLAEHLQRAEEQIGATQRIIDDLLTLSRVLVNRLDVQLEAVDTAAVVQRVVETLKPLAWQHRRIEMALQAAEGLAPACADPGRLEQVVNNLVQNAIRHTPPGGIIVVQVDGGKGTPTLSDADQVALSEPEWVVIRVMDSGAGIPADELPYIWERFYQASSPENRGSAGLGLALVKELTEAMQGQVSVESHAGEGSSFCVWLRHFCDKS